MNCVKSFILLVTLLVFGVGAHAEEGAVVASVHTVDAGFYSSVRGVVDTPDVLMTLTPVLSDVAIKEAAYQKARPLKLAELVKSIDAIEDKEVGLTPEKKLEIADAALSAQEKTGVDAVFLIALARMESDFRGIIQINTPCKLGLRDTGCYADCGMTQHHIRGNARYVKTQCTRLSKDTASTFLFSSQEIASHVKWCSERAHQSWQRPLRRCVLNRYNMGPAYHTDANCKRLYNCSALQLESQASCNASARKCRMRAAYWKRLTCFEYGARKQVRAAKSCRWCTNLAYVNTFFYPRPAPAKTGPDVTASSTKSDQIRRSQPK